MGACVILGNVSGILKSNYNILKLRCRPKTSRQGRVDSGANYSLSSTAILRVQHQNLSILLIEISRNEQGTLDWCRNT